MTRIPAEQPQGLILFQSFYNPTDPERRNEIDSCLNKNLANPAVRQLVLYLDHGRVEYPKHPKILPRCLNDREITFAHAFAEALNWRNRICMLINNDILLDKDSFADLTEINKLCDEDYVVCLSRHEYDPFTNTARMDERFSKLLFAHTQDAWIWKANFIPPNADFPVGILGCDNAINERLRRAGKMPINLASKYKIYHFDAARQKTSGNFLQKKFRQEIRESYPEEQGQFLTPEFHMAMRSSLDDLAKRLGLTQLERYELICDMISKKIKISNRKRDST